LPGREQIALDFKFLSESDPLTIGTIKRAVILLSLLGAALAARSTRVAAQVSLATVVDLAQKNSTAVRLADADVRKAQAALSESKEVVIPTLNFGTGIPAFPEEGFTGSPPSIYSASAQSLVFSIPQKHYIEAARAGMQAASARLKDAREQVALDASSAYIEVDALNQELQTAQQQEGFAARLVEIAQQRAEAGVDPTSALLESQLTAANLKLKRIHLEARTGVLLEQLSALTGMPLGAITTQHASIPEIPHLRGDAAARPLAGIESARMLALSKQRTAKGDEDFNLYPQLNFFLQYNRNTTILNDVNRFFARPLPTNNIFSGFNIQVPLLDMAHRAKARESAAEALRATVEVEEAERQNEVQIAQLTGSLRELDTLEEIASLKQQIASEQLKSVLTQLELGNGTGGEPGAQPQISPEAEQLARIEAGAKAEDALEAGFELSKARLGLLRALGHMDDWLHELSGKQVP
jgi:outer membrane protein TolC